MGNGGTSGSILGNVINNATLVFNRSNNYTPACTIGGTGNLIQAGSGTLTLTGAISNAVFANAGRVVVGPTGMLTGDLTVAAGARVENNATALQLANFINSGTFLGSADVNGGFVNQSPGDVGIAGGQRLYIQGAVAHTNAGLIEVIGNPYALGGQAEFDCLGPLTNAAGTGLITGRNATLRFEGGLTNRGSIGLSYGTTNVSGTINNTGTIAIGGNTAVTFYDDVVQNGTLTVSGVGGTRASAVFFGAVSGSGGISGGGDVFLMGDLRPGNSPGEVVFDANVSLAPSANTVMELGGLSAGRQYDQINVLGSLVLDGDLDVVLVNGFSPASGESFDLFSGNVSGTFDSVSLPSLAQGLSWDTSRLYTAGSVSVVPEPSTLALLLAGAASVAAWIGWLSRRAVRGRQ